MVLCTASFIFFGFIAFFFMYIPHLLDRCKDLKDPKSPLSASLAEVLYAVGNNEQCNYNKLWELTRDFKGQGNRGTQLVTSDFLEFLINDCADALV